jgi:hypothetical protein
MNGIAIGPHSTIAFAESSEEGGRKLDAARFESSRVLFLLSSFFSLSSLGCDDVFFATPNLLLGGSSSRE